MTKGGKRWIYLTVGTIGMLFAGIIYAWSILKGPLTEEFGWQGATLSWNFTITMGMFCIGGIGGSILAKKIGVKLSVIMGGAVCGSGFILSSLLNGQQQILFYLTYGVMAGLGIGVTYNVIVSTVTAWFPEKRGFSSGCLMLGFCFSTLVLGTVSNSLFSSVGWRVTYRILGLSIGTVIIIAGIILKNPYTKSSSSEEKRAATEHGEIVHTQDYTPKQMLSSSLFWRLYIFLIFLTAVGNCVASFAKDLSLFSGAEDGVATTLVGVFAVCNGVFRVVIGMLFDRFGRRRSMLLCSGLAIFTSLICIATALTGSLTICVIALCFAGFTLGCSPTIAAVVANAFFGEKHCPTNFSIVNSNLLPASFLATLSGSLTASSGGYLIPFIIFLIISFIGLFLNLSIRQ